MSKTNNQTRNTLLSLLGALFLFSQQSALALPGTGASNLQTTAGVTTSVNGGTLSITAPNKAILSWQNFGSGSDAISASDTLTYTLPSSSSAVLNIVGGGNRTQIDGTLTSNGNVFVLNPSGIVVGNGSRIDTNQLVLSTSDNLSFANYYFQANGKLPSQDGLSAPSGNITVNGGIVTAPGGLYLAAKNVDLGNLISQGSITVNADGLVNLGNSGLTYVTGNIGVTNVGGLTNLGSAGNTVNVSGDIVVTSVSGSVITSPVGTVVSRSLTVNGGNSTDVNLGKISSSNVTVTGNNISVAFGSVATPTFTGNAAGNTTVTAQSALVANVQNSGTGNTSISTTGPLTLGNIHTNSGGNTSFTGTTITDSVNGVFVYGPVSFTATAGNISVARNNHNFGPVTAAATGEVAIRENDALNLNNIQATKFTAASNAYIFQTSAGSLINSPVVGLTAAGNVTLGSVANTIGNITLTSGGNSTLVNTGSIGLGNIVVPGSFSVTATGTVTQLADTKIASQGSTTFVGTSINLTNAGNQFGGISADATATGNVSITEESTMNLVSLRAANATLKSVGSVITSGSNLVVADNYNVIVGRDFVPTSNFKANNSLTVLATGNADLSLLSLATNLNAKSPSVIALGYKAPTP